jgi:hypothetical protein
VLPSTASVKAPKVAARPKSSGRSLRNAMMNSATSVPMFSMWCNAPESTWNIWPAVAMKVENRPPSSSTETSAVPDTQ